MTNYERVKQTSLEEMVDFINHETDGICSCCHNDVRFGVDRKMSENKYTTADLKAMQAWLRTGCNNFYGSSPKSKPMSFWTEQDVLEYIDRFGLPYAKIYGDIIKDENDKYHATGAHLEKEPNRFQRMKVTHPKQYAFCMKSVSEGGLGLAEVLDYIGVKH